MQVDFVNKYYDLVDDWGLIESSFAMQYGIRLSKEDIRFPEFKTLLSGIMPDTPLGQIVQIRSEKDPKILKTFNKQQKRIRSEWFQKNAKKHVESMSNEEKRKAVDSINAIFKEMFAKVEVIKREPNGR